MRELYEEMMIVEFFNKPGEETFPGGIVWASTDLPLVISQKAVDRSAYPRRIPVL